MAFKQLRKIIRYGNKSEGIILPKEWFDYYGLSRGDEVLILGNSMLIVAPTHLEEKARDIIEQTEGSKVRNTAMFAHKLSKTEIENERGKGE